MVMITIIKIMTMKESIPVFPQSVVLHLVAKFYNFIRITTIFINNVELISKEIHVPSLKL